MGFVRSINIDQQNRRIVNKRFDDDKSAMSIFPDRLQLKLQGLTHILTTERFCYDLISANNIYLRATEIPNYQKHQSY